MRAHVIGAVLSLCAFAAAGAHAAPKVVLVQDASGPALEALPSRVALQTAGRVTVDVVQAAVGNGIEFVGEAGRIIEERGATLVVWIVGSAEPPAPAFVVYAVGAQPDRAVIELVRVDAATAPDEIERTIALKVGTLLDALLAPPPVAAAAAPAAAIVLASPVDMPPRRIHRFWIALGAGAQLGDDRGVSSIVTVAGEWRPRRDAFAFGAGVGVRWAPSESVDMPAARIAVDEWNLRGSAIASITRGRWRGALRASAGIDVVHADGIADDGRRGASTVVTPTAGLGAEVAAWLDPVEVVFGVAYEHPIIQQRFLVDGEVAVDMGVHRMIGSVTMSVPVR